jgi:DNA-binding ferritin-like protein
MKKFTIIKNEKKSNIVEKNTNNVFDEKKLNKIYENIDNNENKSDVVKFFSKLFESREMAHVYHLLVSGDDGSFARHESLGEYYEEVVDIIDDLIEVYQGQYGIIEGYDIIDTSSSKNTEAVEYFKEILSFIKENKNCIPEDDTHIHSLIDDVKILICKTLYKMQFLK